MNFIEKKYFERKRDEKDYMGIDENIIESKTAGSFEKVSDATGKEKAKNSGLRSNFVTYENFFAKNIDESHFHSNETLFKIRIVFLICHVVGFFSFAYVRGWSDVLKNLEQITFWGWVLS